MAKICNHGKWLNNSWVSWYNQIDNDWEKCCVCGALNCHPLPESKEEFQKEIEEVQDPKEDIDYQIDQERALERLPERQKAIAEAVLAGFNQREAGKRLGISLATVEREMREIRKQIGII